MPFKKTKWRDENHMLFESPHKTFNKQADCINTGNIIGNVEYGAYIRAYNNIECNGKTDYMPGDLQNFDLKSIPHLSPNHVINKIRELAKNESIIFYAFFHHNGDQRIMHGWIITKYNYLELARFYANNNWKSMAVLDECAKYVCLNRLDVLLSKGG